MPQRAGARRLQAAIVDLQRITNSRRLHRARSDRAGVSVTPVAGSVLRHVIADGPLRPAQLAEHMRMRPSALSRQLKALEEDGCVERIPVADDKRGWLVRATRRGRGIVARLERADDEILAEQLRGWTAADLDALNDYLDRLIHDLRAPAPTTSRKKVP